MPETQYTIETASCHDGSAIRQGLILLVANVTGTQVGTSPSRNDAYQAL
jgi:hypothetical protein